MPTALKLQEEDDKPEPKDSPAALTANHSFCPMIPPSLIVYRHLNGEAKTLYCWMLMQSHGNCVCHASQELMRKELGCSLDKIQRCLAALEAEGFVKTMVDVDGRTRNQDAYRLLVLPPKRKPKDLRDGS